MPVVLTARREVARADKELGMRCDRQEIPEPGDGSTADGYWLAGSGELSGLLPGPGPDAPARSSLDGTVALAITGSTIYAIVAPQSSAAPAAWISHPLTGVRVTASGVQGVVKKRPAVIEIASEHWTLRLQTVSRLFRASNRHQPGQEQSLVTALGGR